MSKCNKVKNPCKICLGPVNQKNGLQCQGACESWVHYTCLNYTPGRIKDIKTGVINVTCPCPDCKTSMPKEFRTDEPFSCTNMQCPANKPPQCANTKCPRNAGTEAQPPQMGTPCPLGSCGKECKKHTGPLPVYDPRSMPCDPSAPQQMPLTATSSNGDACIDFNRCPSGCSGSNMSGDTQAPRPFQIPMLNLGGACPAGPAMPPGGGFPSISAIEEINNTIGLLSNQMNNMMTRLRDATMPCGKPPSPRGKKMCPKPCFCPGNPAKR